MARDDGIAPSLADVNIALSDAEGFFERFGTEYQSMPEHVRPHVQTLGLGAKRLQVAVARLAEVVAQLQARVDALDNPQG